MAHLFVALLVGPAAYLEMYASALLVARLDLDHSEPPSLRRI
ncbi:MAG TPA: hypothetical protein VM737_00270 [Gemmatimonadota bacterium]|nr:hypothetical protein [Gemmatimonadota bacterium]